MKRAAFVLSLVLSVAASSFARDHDEPHEWPDEWTTVTLAAKCMMRDGSEGVVKFDEKRCLLGCGKSRTRNSRCE